MQFDVVWWDDDFIEVAVAADNGRFAARTHAYVAPSFGPDFARVLEGFPRSPDDERQHTLGTFEDNLAGGGVRMHFQCRDRAAHAGVIVTVRGDPRNDVGFRETASFFVRLEAAAVDDFVRQLKSLSTSDGSWEAHLRSL